jgi:hypothetical protein
MGMPDGLSDTLRSQLDLLLARFLQGEIVAAQSERVTASALGRNSQYDFIVSGSLGYDFEVEDAVRTQIDIIDAARKDGNTRVY